jgi:hypothetical protein
MKYTLGRYAYGWTAIGFGVLALTWHDVDALGTVPYRATLVYVAAAILSLGGIAIQWPRSARTGAVALGAVYLAFALLGIPVIIAHPLVYNGYGNFFEQLSLATGACIVYASFAPIASIRAARLAWTGYYAFAVCVISFALEQLFYLSATASLVPKWIPPGQTFWAVATSVAFVLAAFALLTGFMAPLAARLTTAMILGFGALVWLPALVANPHSFENWSETVETLAIAACAWIVAGFLEQRRSTA